MDAKDAKDARERVRGGAAPAPREYKTPRWVQVWFLRRSRDNWKKKYMALRTEAKRLQNRVNDVTKSRERWRALAEADGAGAAGGGGGPPGAALKKGGAGGGAARPGPDGGGGGEWDEWEQCQEWGPPAGGMRYELGVVCLLVRLVMAGVSLRGAPRVLELVAAAWGLPFEAPHWATGRLWLLRLGHFMLTRPLEKARDWAWLVDHSVQVGKQKVLVVLGVRLKDQPPPGRCLRLADLRLVALEPRESWTRQEVSEALERAALRTGVPRAIADDHGVDLHGGVLLFQGRHPETAELYDTKHKAACLLKARLGKNQRWQEFQRQAGQARCAVQQTELAFLAPPSPRPKARYMNLGPLLAWARHVLAVLRHPEAVSKWASPQRLEEKLAWVREFEAEVAEWSRWQAVIDAAVAFVGRNGLSLGSADALGAELSQLDQGPGEARRLAEELERFVREQEARAEPGERLPGSTEALESCFGKFKHLEKQQSRGGFTSLVLALGAMLGDAAGATADVLRQALQHSRTEDVYAWCKQHLGTTVFAQRKLAYAAGATEDG